MKVRLGIAAALVVLASSAALFAPIPARADTTSDLAQCEKTVKFKTGDISSDGVAACMLGVNYRLDPNRRVDTLTRCRNMLFPGIEVRCYRKDGVRDTGRVPPPVTANWRAKKIDDLLAEEADWNGKCRASGPSMFYTEDICNRRDRLVMVLEARGWCHPAGSDNSDANKIWQPCRPETD
jgi:hypothetical protein